MQAHAYCLFKIGAYCLFKMGVYCLFKIGVCCISKIDAYCLFKSMQGVCILPIFQIHAYCLLKSTLVCADLAGRRHNVSKSGSIKALLRLY